MTAITLLTEHLYGELSGERREDGGAGSREHGQRQRAEERARNHAWELQVVILRNKTPFSVCRKCTGVLINRILFYPLINWLTEVFSFPIH